MPEQPLPATAWVAIFANPASGSGPNRRRIELLVDALRASGLEAVVSWRPAEESPWLADSAALRECRAIVAAGGDGTANRVANARPAAPLAFFPLGTENLLAKEFGFRRDAAALIARIRKGRSRAVDLGVARGRRFFLMVTAGFDAEVARRFDRWRTAKAGVRRVRHWHYLRPILGAFSSYRYPRIDLDWGSGVASAALAMVFNVASYARRMRPVPGAFVADGLLDWLVLESPGRGALAGFALDLFLGRHLARRDVRHGRARELRMSSAQPVPVQLDGESAGFTPVDIAVSHRAVRVLV